MEILGDRTHDPTGMPDCHHPIFFLFPRAKLFFIEALTPSNKILGPDVTNDMAPHLHSLNAQPPLCLSL